LAFLNRIGVIDAVLSDDVDTFVFGGTMVIRKCALSSHPSYLLLTHPSPNSSLSGNHAHPVAGSSAKDDGNHVVVFTASEFDLPEINLTHGGLILIALLSGGDYHQAGLSGCGPKVAHGLAKCGFGDSLLSAARTLSREDLQEHLTTWKKELAEELRTNSRGILGRRYNSLSKAIPEEFPDIDILMSYANPITSETEGKTHKIKATWERPLDLGRIAHVCELYFEWGVRHAIIKRFRTVIWPAAVFRFLRESILEEDPQKGGRPPLLATTHLPQTEPPSSSPATSTAASLSHLQIGGSAICQDLILKIHSTRNHHSTDGLLEYRLEISPERLVALASAGIKDIRPPLISDISSSDDTANESDKRMKKPPPDPSSNLRVWIPACIVKATMPSLIDSFEGVKRTSGKKSTRTKPTTRSKPVDTRTPPTPEDAEKPQKRDPRPKPNLKLFYPVKKLDEQALKSTEKPPGDDRSVLGGRSKILALVDNIAATGASQHDVPDVSRVTAMDKGFPTTGMAKPKIVDVGKRSRPPQARAHPIFEVSPVPTPAPPQKSTPAPQDSTPGGVIEISSDSDEGDSAPPRPKSRVAPLLVVMSRRRAQPQIPNDIIDLT
jgi:Holliday junction resolvase YEN1